MQALRWVRDRWFAPLWPTGPSRWQQLIGMDRRSLALFRIAVGYVCFWDVWDRMDDMYSFFTDSGVMPRHHALESFWNHAWISPHFISGTWIWQFILFTFHMFVALCFMFGFHTRKASMMLLALTNSINARNVLIMHGGDLYMRVILFFAMLLPLGDVCSIDAALSNDCYRTGKVTIEGRSTEGERDADKDRGGSTAPPPSNTCCLTIAPHARPGQARDQCYAASVAARQRVGSMAHVADFCTLSLGIQLSLIYVSAGLCKTDKVWTQDLTATYYALQLDFFRTWWTGEFLLNTIPWWLSKALTWSVLRWELYGPVFFYIPVLQTWSKGFGVLGHVALHIGFGMAFRLGEFAIFGMAAPLCMLPSAFWDHLLFPYLRTRERTHAKVLYTESRAIYRFTARVLGNMFLLPETVVMSLEAASGRTGGGREGDGPAPAGLLDDHPFMVVDDRGNVHAGYDALLLALRLSPVLFPLGWVLRIGFVARMGRAIADWLPDATTMEDEDSITPSVRRPPPASNCCVSMLRWVWRNRLRCACNILAGLCLIFITCWVAGNHGRGPGVVWYLHWWGSLTGLSQAWGMFSPRPPDSHFYHLIKAQQIDGNVVEIFRNEGMYKWESNPWSEDKPDQSVFFLNYKNHRWYKLWESFNYSEKWEKIRLDMGRYICREWNGRHHEGDTIFSFEIIEYVHFQNLNHTRTPLGQWVQWSHQCFDKKPKWPR